MRTSIARFALTLTAPFALASSLAACDETYDPGSADGVTPPLDATAPHDASSADADAGEPADSAPDVTLPACDGDGGTPEELRCTGLYADWAKKKIAANAKYYEPGYKLWSDGAAKRRWIQWPAHTQIDTSDMDEWTFPIGTKVWKEFSLGGAVGDGGTLTGGKTIETRYLWKISATKWGTAVYRWSEDQTSTRRLTANEMVPQPDGGPDYEIPGPGTCINCHAGRKDFVLGFEAVGLGVKSAGATGGLTLSQLAEGSLTTPPPETTIALPDDATDKAPAALGMLHMNCGVSCHNAGGGKAGYTGLYMRLRMDQLYPDGATAKVTDLDTYKTAVNVTGTLAFGKYKRIAPGDSASSLVPLMGLARTPDAGAFLQMPPILTHRADLDPTTGMPVVEAWIDGL